MKICTVIGARPQFVKAAALSAKISEASDCDEIIVHTGQHYDAKMSDIFFSELGIPKEKYNLQVGSGPHGWQTARMLEEIEKILLTEKPDWLVVYGDTNSTLAGALAAVKLHIPIAHVEAGMRSFNRIMPEENNRVMTDHIATLNLCSTPIAIENLKNEGRGETAVLVGDVMYDCSLNFATLAKECYNIEMDFNVKPNDYILVTCHRAENTDDPKRLGSIVDALNQLSESYTVMFPLHPRTRKYISSYDLKLSEHIITSQPLSYLEMLLLEKNAILILTDSGGVQKEAFFCGSPCVTMRDETEWLETVDLGWNIITGADTEKIMAATDALLKNPLPSYAENPYGDGNASGKILDAMRNFK